jgi:hypothetical protein
MTVLIFRVRILAGILRISVFIMTILKLAKICFLWRKGTRSGKTMDLALISAQYEGLEFVGVPRNVHAQTIL